MSHSRLSLLVGTGFALLAFGPARSETPPPLGPVPAAIEAAAPGGTKLTFNLGAASDYVFRGVSQTEDGGQVFGGADLTGRAGYVGIWASNVAFAGDEETRLEVDVYGGWKRALGPWTVDLGAIAYLYPDAPDQADYDFVEAKLAVGRSLGRLSLGASVFASPSFFGDSGAAAYYGVDGGWTITDRLTGTVSVMRQDVERGIDYNTWNAGLTLAVTERISADGRWTDTDADALGEPGEGRLVGSVKAVF